MSVLLFAFCIRNHFMKFDFESGRIWVVLFLIFFMGFLSKHQDDWPVMHCLKTLFSNEWWICIHFLWRFSFQGARCVELLLHGAWGSSWRRFFCLQFRVSTSLSVVSYFYMLLLTAWSSFRWIWWCFVSWPFSRN